MKQRENDHIKILVPIEETRRNKLPGGILILIGIGLGFLIAWLLLV